VTFADDEWGDQLNDHLDALTAGEAPRDIDPANAEAVRRFFARDDTPSPPRDLTAQIWEDLMNQSASAGTIPLHPPLAARPPLNGRVRYRPWRQGPPRLTASHHQRRWSHAQLAAALLLVATLVAGYFAFGPLRPDPDRPMSIPAAVAPAATPGTPYPMVGHPIIGTWQWSNGGGSYISFGTFLEDGGYVEAGPGGFVGVGIWRATGERTAELVVNVAQAAPLAAVFEPRYVIDQDHLVVPGMGFARMMIEVDATGNHFTATGAYEEPDANGDIIQTRHVSNPGDRMTVAVDTAVTPTP
jgi:hypothetical protein